VREDLTTRPQHDYYQILGVACWATEQEIKAAFARLSTEFHAAGKPANIEAVERFRRIVRAYRVLGDDQQRRRYDQFGEDGIVMPPLSSGLNPEELEKWADLGYSNPLPSTMGRMILLHTLSIVSDSIDRV
jgi:DnaJ-class molecular chaperone